MDIALKDSLSVTVKMIYMLEKKILKKKQYYVERVITKVQTDLWMDGQRILQKQLALLASR